MSAKLEYFRSRGDFGLNEPSEPGWYWLLVKDFLGRLKLVPAEVIFPPRKKRPRIRTCHGPHCRQGSHLLGHTSADLRYIAWGTKIEEPVLDHKAIIAHLQKEAAPEIRFVDEIEKILPD